MKLYQMTMEDRERDAIQGKDLTLEFLANNGFISADVAKELSKTLFVVAKKKSWFSNIFNSKDESIRWRLAKLTEVPTEENEDN